MASGASVRQGPSIATGSIAQIGIVTMLYQPNRARPAAQRRNLKLRECGCAKAVVIVGNLPRRRRRLRVRVLPLAAKEPQVDKNQVPKAVRVPITRGAPPPEVCAQLDRYDIAVVFQAAFEWDGYRYSNPADAIAAAKRGRPQ